MGDLTPRRRPQSDAQWGHFRRKRVGLGHGGHEGVSVHLPWRSGSACGFQREPAVDDTQTGLLPLVPAFPVLLPFP